MLSRGGARQIADLLRSGADDDTLAAAWVPLVCSRLVAGKDVPPDVTKAARSCLNTPADILRYNAGASGGLWTMGVCTPLLRALAVLSTWPLFLNTHPSSHCLGPGSARNQVSQVLLA